MRPRTPSDILREPGNDLFNSMQKGNQGMRKPRGRVDGTEQLETRICGLQQKELLGSLGCGNPVSGAESQQGVPKRSLSIIIQNYLTHNSHRPSVKCRLGRASAGFDILICLSLLSAGLAA